MAQAVVTVVWLCTLGCSGSTVPATRSTTSTLPPEPDAAAARTDVLARSGSTVPATRSTTSTLPPPEPDAAPVRAEVLGRGCPASHAEAVALVGVLPSEQRQVSGTELPRDALVTTETRPPWPRECVYPEGTCRVIEYDDACVRHTEFRCDRGEDGDATDPLDVGRPCTRPTPM